MVPGLLRWMFIFHFVVDYLFAIPLMLFPEQTMVLLGWDAPEPVATRLVAAALMGIGGISFLARDADLSAYRHMLTMKLLWSGAAVLGLSLSLAGGAPGFTLVFLGIFAVFFFVWLFFRLRLRD